MNLPLQKYRDSVDALLSLVNMQDRFRPDQPYTDAAVRQAARLLAFLGDPQEDAKRMTIHVTGTAGKGTVSQMIGEALHAARLSVGVHTSPYATTLAEEYWVNGAYVSARDVIWGVDRINEALNRLVVAYPKETPGYMAARTALAFLLFHRHRVRWQVIEVTMGGTRSSTNVLSRCRVAVVTNIGHDHLDRIGPTLADVAREKAGIVRKGTVLITAERRPELRRVLEQETKRRGGIFRPLPMKILETLAPGEENAFLTQAVGETIGIAPRHIDAGIQRAFVPCRREIVSRRPLVILDGAHNILKLQPLLELLSALPNTGKRHLLLGMAADKDARAFVRALLPHVDTVTLTRFLVQERRVLHPGLLAQTVRASSTMSPRVFIDPMRAFDDILKRARPQDVVIATGSFFLVGHLRERWYSEERVLRKRASR